MFPELYDELDELDGCELLHHIGGGGMGDVHLAAAPDRNGRRRPVALKRLRPDLREDRWMVERFVDEARLVGTLGGPGLVTPVDVSRARSQHYYTMEFIDGTTLADLMRAAAKTGNRLPLEVSLQIVRGAAGALQRLHDKEDADGRPMNLVHCDVSPPNILVTPTGHVRLVDYGLCRGTHNTVSPLHHGRVLGTLSYMSPEQSRGEDVDHRSDIFSLGILLWELITFSRLFRGEGADDVAGQVKRGKVPAPRELRPDIPRELEGIAVRALRPNARVRFQSAKLFQRALERFMQREGVEGSPRIVGSCLRNL